MHGNMHWEGYFLWLGMKVDTKCVPEERGKLWASRTKTLWGMLDLHADFVL